MRSLLVKSDISLDDLNINFDHTLIITDQIFESYEDIYKSVSGVSDASDANDASYNIIYGAGGMIIIDITKYLSNKFNCSFILIPTILESDNIFTNTILDINNNIYLDCSKNPKKIIIDDNILQKTTYKNHASGWATILSSLTACYSWRNYKDEFDIEYDPEIDFEINSCISRLSCPNNKKNRMELLNTLKVYVDIEKTYGSTIYKESSEHYFVYNLYNYWQEKCLFGESLVLGILLMSQIANHGFAKKSLHLMKKCGIKGIMPPKEIIIKTLSTLKEFVEYNDFNFSIINTKKFHYCDFNEIVDTVYLMIMDLNYNNFLVTS